MISRVTLAVQGRPIWLLTESSGAAHGSMYLEF